VLKHFGRRKYPAQKRHRNFVEKGIGRGRNPDQALILEKYKPVILILFFSICFYTGKRIRSLLRIAKNGGREKIFFGFFLDYFFVNNGKFC
jgi:hypothetical protein